MLEQFLIFTKGGLVLFQHGAKKLAGDPATHLVQSVLLENRSGDSSFSHDKYTLEWLLLNEHDLILVVVYEKLLARNVTYAQELLQAVSDLVRRECGSRIPSRGGVPAASDLLPSTSFSDKFQKVFVQVVEEVENRKSTQKAPGQFWDTKKGQELIKNRGATPDAPPSPASTPSPSTANPDSDAESDSVTKPGKKLSKLEMAALKRKQKAEAKESQGGTKTKTPGWKEKKVDVKDLNKSEKGGDGEDGEESSHTGSAVDIDKITFEDEKENTDDDEVDDSDEDDGKAASSSRFSGGLFKFITNLTQKELTAENLKPVMDDMRSHLIAKNVASDIAENICDSVSQSLIGQTHGNFKSISATVRAAMEEALTRILTPKRHIDISREIQAAKDVGRPYTIVFVGVNGVGKSTSLAKVCAWLIKQQHRLMIAACDTFRSGAVEQLKVHAKALGGIPVFDQGYGKDAAFIAQQAIAKAHTEAIDVVLIDTAGRMQDNEPLMAALAKLVKVNKPDLILFVGEALVGNDSVDQLVKFNRALEEYGDLSQPRAIDGLVLTKFDTVDDKVGAAISMVYTTGQPIVFVGVGQTYADLRTLNVQKIVDILARGRS